MKKNEIALLILIIAASGVTAYFIINALMGQAVSKPIAVEKAEVMTSDVTEPSKDIFGDNAINPTVKVSIGNNTDRQPFTLR